MKTTRTTATLLAFLLTLGFSATQAFSAPIDPKGVPADAIGIVHFDVALAAKSALVPALKQLAQKQNKDSAQDLEKWQKLTGIDPEKDIHGATIAFIKPADTGEPRPRFAGPALPTYATIIRGNFSPDKIISAAKSAKELKATVATRGSLTIITIPPTKKPDPFADPDNPPAPEQPADAESNDSESNDSDDPDNKPTYAAIVDKGTILLAPSLDTIDKIAATLAGKNKSYTLPDSLTAFGKKEGSPMLLGYMSGEASGSAAMMMGDQPKNTFIFLGEKGAALRFHILAEFLSAKAAADSQKNLQGLLAMLPMMAMQARTPDQSASAKKAMDVLKSLKVTTDAANLSILFEHPVADLIELMK